MGDSELISKTKGSIFRGPGTLADQFLLKVLANEYNSVSLVIGYWTDAVPQWGWILIFWFLFLGLSNLGILAYGEMEFWLSL